MMPENKDSSGTDVVLVAAGLVIGLVLLFSYDPGLITTPWAWLKSTETRMLLHLPLPRSSMQDLRYMQGWFNRHPAGSIGIHQMWLAADAVGQVIKLPVALVLFVLGGIRIFRRVFRCRHSVDTLLAQESTLWPQTRIMTQHRPDLDQDPHQGVWALAEKPVAFATRHGIVKDDGSFDEPAATAAFEQQMGPPWKGVQALTDVERQIFVILAARVAEDLALEREIKKELALAYAGDGSLEQVNARVTEAAASLERHESVLAIIKQHAWVRTVLPKLLFIGRSIGALPTADFLWLKTQDRALWYVLNNVGRRVAWVEVAGPWAHWLAERAIGRPLEAPMVDQAVTALEEHLRMSGQIED